MKKDKNMLIYGVGAHLADMLNWHPDLSSYVIRLFDKDNRKVGKKYKKLGIVIEPICNLKKVPAGSILIVSAVHFFGEIVQDVRKINSGLVCVNIDEAYESLRESVERQLTEFGRRQSFDSHQVDKIGLTYLRLYDLVRQGLRKQGCEMPITRFSFYTEIESMRRGRMTALEMREYEKLNSYDFLEVLYMRCLMRIPAESEIEGYVEVLRRNRGCKDLRLNEVASISKNNR